jgi:hypothetical protein
VKKRNAYRLLIGRSEGKIPLGRPRRRWIDNIKMNLVEIGRSHADWIGLAQESSCECCNEPSGSISCWESIDELHNSGLWSSSQLHIVCYLLS